LAQQGGSAALAVYLRPDQQLVELITVKSVPEHVNMRAAPASPDDSGYEEMTWRGELFGLPLDADPLLPLLPELSSPPKGARKAPGHC